MKQTTFTRLPHLFLSTPSVCLLSSNQLLSPRSSFLRPVSRAFSLTLSPPPSFCLPHLSRSIFIPSPTELTSGSYWQSEQPFSHKRLSQLCVCVCVLVCVRMHVFECALQSVADLNINNCWLTEDFTNPPHMHSHTVNHPQPLQCKEAAVIFFFFVIPVIYRKLSHTVNNHIFGSKCACNKISLERVEIVNKPVDGRIFYLCFFKI